MSKEFTRPKRNSKLNKFYKQDLKCLDELLGEVDAGLLLHSVVRTLYKLLGDKDSQILRTIEIKINDYFSSKWDFQRQEYVDE